MMRILDTALAFPFLVLVIVIVAVIGPGLPGVYLAVFLLAWTLYARLARAEMLVERKKDYMLAAQTLGYPTTRIIFRHALPNIISSSIVFSMADYVLQHPALGQPELPRPRRAAAQSRVGLDDCRSTRLHLRCVVDLHTCPALVIVLAGTGLSLIGDGLAHRLGQRHQVTV